MSRFVRWISSVLTIVWLATPAMAQTVSQAGAPFAASCASSGSQPGAFDHCKLTLERTRLKQGTSGDVIARLGFLRPIRLTQFVVGDSAQRYARSYERNTRIAMRIEAVGVGLFVSSLLASRGCTSIFCARNPSHGATRTAELAGVAIVAIGIPFQIHGRHEGYKAVAFHNAALAH